MKTAIAETTIECNVKCPYCDEYQDRFDDLHEYYYNGDPRAVDIEVVIKCDNCKVDFMVTEIEY